MVIDSSSLIFALVSRPNLCCSKSRDFLFDDSLPRYAYIKALFDRNRYIHLMTSYLGNESSDQKSLNFEQYKFGLDTNAKIRFELSITVLKLNWKNPFSRKKIGPYFFQLKKNDF